MKSAGVDAEVQEKSRSKTGLEQTVRQLATKIGWKKAAVESIIKEKTEVERKLNEINKEISVKQT